MRHACFFALALASLHSTFALDLKFETFDGDNKLVIPKAAIQFIQQANGKVRIGTLVGVFEIPPLMMADEADSSVDGLTALKAVIDQLLELNEPLDIGEHLRVFNELRAGEQSPGLESVIFQMTLWTGGAAGLDTLTCVDIKSVSQ